MVEEKQKKIQVKRYMRASELSIYLSISKSSIWKYLKEKRIESIKIGGNVTLFEVAEVEKALFGDIAS